MWTNPSTSGNTSTNAPNAVVLRTTPSNTSPALIVARATSHCVGNKVLAESETFSFSLSTAITATLTVSPTDNTSATFSTRAWEISEMCNNPSTSPMLTNAPKSVIRLTLPSITSPSLMFPYTSASFLAFFF